MKHRMVKIVVLLLGLSRVAGAQVADVSWINPHWQGLTGYSGSFLTCEIGEDFDLADQDIEYALTGIAITETGNKGKSLNLYGREGHWRQRKSSRWA